MKQDQVVLLTGATGVIGREIAKLIARRMRGELVLSGRDGHKLNTVVAEVRRIAPELAVRPLVLDVSRRQEVYDAAAKFDAPLHVLINNAAIAPVQRTETADGLELVFATNIMAYVWMTDAFTKHLASASPARVVNVASVWAGDLDVNDLQFQRRRYDNNAAYRQSKAANRMLSVVYAERLKGQGISVNSCHPGDVSSTLSNALGFGGSMTAIESAKTPAWLATDDIGLSRTGKYFAFMNEASCEFAKDRRTIDALASAIAAFA